MEKLDLNSFTKDQLARAMECKTVEELIELAKKYDIEITKEQAEAYLDELHNVELGENALDKIAGGLRKSGWKSKKPHFHCSTHSGDYS